MLLKITTLRLHKFVHMYNSFAISYLNFHASNRFAQFEHDKDQAWVNRLPAAGTGLLPAVDI